MTSPTNLWEALQYRTTLCAYNPPPPIILGAQDFHAFVGQLAKRIGYAAKRAAKQAQQNVDLLRGTGLYCHLDNPIYRRAAAVAELFRSGKLASNAGYLDVTRLQRYIVEASSGGRRLVYELGWGQAKRDAGGLKTVGSNADLAELVALGRLSMMVLATSLILDEPAALRIISGGRRFYEALFVRLEQDAAYNDQRAALVAALGQQDAISFETIERYWSEEDIRTRLAEALESHATVETTESEFRFVLFNIDWHHLLDTQVDPHGLPPPPGVRVLWRSISVANRALLLRHVLAGIANPKLEHASLNLIETETLREIAAWATAVTRISALKYRLLGYLTQRNIENVVPGQNPVMLTVVEKRTRPDIPALLLLGRRAGDTLPQHVIPVLQASQGLAFELYLLVVDHYAPVLVPLPETSGQPFCLSALDPSATLRALMQLDIFDGG
jgi:hypothetical protein